MTTAPSPTGKLQSLSADELDFVDKYVSSKFLHQFGTTIGFNEFCKLAVKTGMLKTCAGGAAKRNKQAYATYLKNTNWWGVMNSEYRNQDAFTKQGMATQVVKGNGLSSKVKEEMSTSRVYGACLKKTVDQLKTTILDVDPSIARKDLAGLKKVELCALLDSLMDATASDAFWKMESDPSASMLYADMPKATPKTAPAKAYAAYRKKYIPGKKPQKPQALMANLLEGTAPGAYTT